MDERVKPLYDTLYTAIGCKNNATIPLLSLQKILLTARQQLTLVPDQVKREELLVLLNSVLIGIQSAIPNPENLPSDIWPRLIAILDKVHRFEQPVLQKQPTYLGCSNKVYTEQYLKEKKSFSSLTRLIERTEDDTMNSPNFNPHLHGLLHHALKGFLHARVNQNIRILYFVDRNNNRVIFERVVKHDEIDLH